MVIEVSIPSSMVVLRNFPVETVVGSYLKAAVTMKGRNGNDFKRIILECAFLSVEKFCITGIVICRSLIL